MEEAVHFVVPTIYSNPTGWGPPETSIPKQFTELPFAPYSKNARVGGVADFSSSYATKYRPSEETEFHLVDSTKTSKKKGFRTRQSTWRAKKVTARRRSEVASSGQAAKQSYGKYDQQQRRRTAGAGRGGAPGGASTPAWGGAGRGAAGGGRGGGGAGAGGFRRFDKDKIVKESSVEVKADWEVIEQLDFTALTKLRDDIPEPVNILQCGSVGYYDKVYDKVNTKTRKALKRIDKTFFKVTTTDDPIIKHLSLEDEMIRNFDGNVIFGTDAIISALMCSSRSHYSWDIVVRRVGPKLLFFDKRDKSQFDYLTVNETASEPPREDDKEVINTPSKLSHEASYINQNFSQQVLSNVKPYTFSDPNPFQGSLSNEEMASVAYRYRRWDLGDGNMLVCRCEIDAVVAKPGRDEFLTVKALNEYDSRVSGTDDWRQKLDSQRGGVLATELKNNSFKLARWTAQALLAGTDEFKLGWVSRSNPKDAFSHQLLGLQTWKPTEFANQINLSEPNMWGVLKHYIDMCMALEPGTYLFLKDPNKRLVRLYQVPEDAFTEQEEEYITYDISDGDDDEDLSE